MSRIYCPHCWPTKTRSHFNNHIEYYHDKLLGLFFKHKKENNFWGKFLEVLAAFGAVEFVDNPNESNLYNRSLIFFKEAKKRRLNIYAIQAFGRFDNTFNVILNDSSFYYDSIPLNRIGKKTIDLDNKIVIKKILQKSRFPVAQGGCFTNKKKAIEFSRTLDYPLIVKPNSGSLSHHVVGPIKSEKDLVKAIEIAQLYRPDFIVEEFVVGKLYRVTVIGQKHVFVCQKEPANVVGDGRSTIKQLIETKNKKSKRSVLGKLDSTLHKISIDDVLMKHLRLQNLTLQSILPKNKKIYLHSKIILSAGCDVIACTDFAHPDNKNMFLKIAETLSVDVVGIDFICRDITKPYHKQKSAIIETNSLPYVDMHQYPSHGKPDPVAKLVWDVVLSGTSK